MGKAVVSMKDVEKRMSVYSSGARARLAQGGGNQIGTRNSRFTYKQEVIGRELRVIVLEFIHENSYYDTDFDPDNPSSPACLAYSLDGKDMAPFNNSPNRQNEQCDGCPQNAWGSAERGRGKACKERYRVAVMECDADPADAEIAYLSIPPTSRKNFNRYVTGLDAKLGKPPFGVVTLFSFDEEEENPTIVAEVDSEINDAAKLAAIMDRIESVTGDLMEPPDFSGYEGDSSPKKKRATTKKKATRKKASKKKASKKTAKKKATRKKRGSKFA